MPGYGGDAARDKGDPCILCNDSQKELRVSAEIIVNAAVKAKEKPKKYAFHEALDGFRGGPAGSDIGSYKCNKFVYDVMNESGATVLTNWRNNIPSAAQWADPSYAIGGWWVVKKPRAGDVAAIMLGSGTTDGATGHVGIVSDPVRGRTISAAHDGVVENDWGFRTGQTPTFRRFWSLMTLEERLCGCM